MRLFHLYRKEDQSGVSGTGPVVEGVEFTNGWCAIRWLSTKSSLCFYQSLEEVRAIHGHGGKTELIVHDFEPIRKSSTMTPLASAGFEILLQIIEETSRVTNMAELPETSIEEIQSALNHIRNLLARLEKALSHGHIPKSA